MTTYSKDDISQVFVDADQMLYACGFASEGEEIANGCYLIKKKLNEIAAACGLDFPSEMDVYIQGGDNFREELDFNYKANRTGRKPDNYEELRKYLIDHWDAMVVDGRETDDEVSIMLTQYPTTGCIASPDKDLKNTPGWHYNYQKSELFYVTERQAHRHLWYQMLMGDSVDNIKGLPYCADRTRLEYGLSGQAKRGCGAASAKKIIESVPFEKYMLDENNASEVQEVVKQAYSDWGEEEGMHENEVWEYMNLQYQLLYMVRELDEDDQPIIPSIPFDPASMVYDHAYGIVL